MSRKRIAVVVAILAVLAIFTSLALAQSPQGPPERVLGFYVNHSGTCDIGPEEYGSCDAFCDTGDASTGGTFWRLNPEYWDYQYEGGAVWESGGGETVGWQVRIRNDDPIFTRHIVVQVICADMTP